MNKIRFVALGGLGENGKNMYVLEVDDNIFILDAGLKYPSVDLLGIDAIYPSMEYLEENSNKIKGLFLSHAHDEQMGAVIEVLKRFQISVFGTHFTLSILEDVIKEARLKVEDYRLYRINEDKQLKFGKTKVEFYNVSHSIPEAIHIAVITEDGAIVYAPDFTFDINNDKKYQISFGRINDISKCGVLALASESLGTANGARTTNNYKMDLIIKNALLKRNRTFFTVYSNDIEKIQRVTDIAINNGKRIAIIGRKSQRLVNIATNAGYLKIPDDKLVNLKFRNETITNEEKDLAIIVTGLRHEPFYMLQRMCNGQDRLLQLNKDDTLVMLTPVLMGCERIASRTVDMILEKDIDLTQLSTNDVRSTHASVDNLKMLYTMLKPKYIIPISGEYRHQYMQRNVALEVGYKPSNIIMLDNGEVAYFKDGNFINKDEKIKTGDVLVDGSMIGDINDVVLKDREMLSEEGIIFINVAIDTKHRSMMSEPKLVSKGIAFNIDEIAIELNDLVCKQTLYYLNKRNLDLVMATEYLRKKLNDFIYLKTKKRPIIIPTFIDIK